MDITFDIVVHLGSGWKPGCLRLTPAAIESACVLAVGYVLPPSEDLRVNERRFPPSHPHNFPSDTRGEGSLGANGPSTRIFPGRVT